VDTIPKFDKKFILLDDAGYGCPYAAGDPVIALVYRLLTVVKHG
jgi:hypothetical protein